MVKRCLIAVDAPIDQPLTYLYDSQVLNVVRGQSVQVPLGRRKAYGVVLKSDQPEDSALSSESLKSIIQIAEDRPIIPEQHLKLVEWMSDYYIYPIGQIAALCFPPLDKTDKVRKSKRPPVIDLNQVDKQVSLSDEQQHAYSAISKQQGFGVHLLHGVTGSGKTEVYLRLISDNLDKNKTALMLVPEISLTPQLTNRFVARFGDQVAVLHSQLTDRERTNQWWDVVEGRKKILIGARSALFCPMPELGLILVDEEHEASFKQDEKLKYHGRDGAIVLGKLVQCPIVLGSATPSLESWKNMVDGRYHLHQLKNRVANRSLPFMKTIDMRQNPALLKDFEWLSEELHTAMTETLNRGDQVALFLNRRGMAQVVLCSDCGFVKECPNCEISLTLHAGRHLVCHYCDYHENLQLECPSCKTGELKPIGLGTERVHNELEKLFPDKKIARADRDEITTRADLESLIKGMESGEVDILVGTQMISKGLDFEKLKLVGILLADIGFNLPDFRSSERSFQLLTQVAGRSGRHVIEGEEPGKVLIQTFNPDHSSLQFALNHDFEGFVNFELSQRQILGYPPFGKIISFRTQSTVQSKAQEGIGLLAKRLNQLKKINPQYKEVEILGPTEAAIAKLRGQFRYHLLLKCPDYRTVQGITKQALGDLKWLNKGVRLITDVDPYNLL